MDNITGLLFSIAAKYIGLISSQNFLLKRYWSVQWFESHNIISLPKI